jgi:TolB-like protein
MKNAFLLLSFLFLCGLCYSQQTAVAVFPFEAQGGVSQTDADSITRIFEIKLQATGAIRVVPRNTINQTILNEHDYQMSDFSNGEKTAQWRRGLNADWIVDGIVSRLGRSFLITSRLLDLNSQELMGGMPVQIDRIEDAPAMMNAAIEEMARRLTGGTAALASRPPTDPRYFEVEVKDGEVFITSYTGTDTEVVIPQTISGMPVTGIRHLGWDSYMISSITIPVNIIHIADSAFYGCLYFRIITVDQRNSHFSSFDGVLFNKNKTRLIKFPPSRKGTYTVPAGVTIIDNYAFSNCSLTSVTMPSGITTIGNHAFFTSSLTSVTMPSGITTIGDYAFSYNNLTSITIPASVTTIGEGAFHGCNLRPDVKADIERRFGSGVF